MKIFTEQIQIESPLTFQKEKRILGLSDLHYGKISYHLYFEFLNTFIHSLCTKYHNKIDYILIPGDLIFYINHIFLNTNFFEQLKYDLQMLSDRINAPIIISYGNHDMPLFEKNISKKEKRRWDIKFNLDNRKNGIYVLNNEQILINDICITGFSPIRNDYSTNAMPNSALQNVYNQFQKCNFHFDSNQINILLSHENKFFTHPQIINEYQDLYEKLTLILGGHLHDGYIPLWFQRLTKNKLKDYGIWEKIPPKINMCRGAFVMKNNNLNGPYIPNDKKMVLSLNQEQAVSIILRGVAKYSWLLPSTPTVTEIEIVSRTKKKKE